ncbi:caspase-3-like [Babylonia areolata]|uniref:caspase-3-like n=1 Tax=Babylonia areolata TaxID=304850 RepID=UPI003FD01BEB
MNQATDEKDFPMSLSSVKKAVKSLISSSEECQSSEPVVWDDSDEYDTTHSRCGIALIIINETFRGHKGRTGSQLDADNLSRTFSSLGFEVRMLRDCTLHELKHVLGQVAKEDHSDSDCFVLALSSHGDEITQDGKRDARLAERVREDVVFCTDFYLTTRELVLHFSDTSCPTLKGKPRLFFLQACRGDQLDEGQEVKVIHSAGEVMDEVDAPVPEVVVSPAPCFKDCLIMCATPPGYYAFRRPTDGSWFVQALCSVLEQCDGSHDILQLLTKTLNIVAHQYMSFTPLRADTDKKKQTPCIYSMLTKTLYWRVRQQPGKILTWK